MLCFGVFWFQFSFGWLVLVLFGGFLFVGLDFCFCLFCFVLIALAYNAG